MRMCCILALGLKHSSNPVLCFGKTASIEIFGVDNFIAKNPQHAGGFAFIHEIMAAVFEIATQEHNDEYED